MFASVSLQTVKLSAQTTLRVGLVAGSSAAAASIDRGVRLGALEAKQTAQLFAGDVLLFEESSRGAPEAAAQKLLSERKVQVLFGSSAEDADALSRFAETHQIIFFNVASRSPTLRAACRRYTFHVEAGDSMYANASVRGAASAASTNVVLWAPTLERYGASQINNRFRARYQLSMDGGAWAGWVAVKIAAEAALRVRSANPRPIRAFLENPSTSFDGHKGWPLSFRSSDHQLRQPLYVSTGTSAPAAAFRDVPQLTALSGAASANTNAGQALDVLMPKSAPRCKWGR
jgi:ABC-type branched-subunit amino acid transport system substrate-binding protein